MSRRAFKRVEDEPGGNSSGLLRSPPEESPPVSSGGVPPLSSGGDSSDLRHPKSTEINETTTRIIGTQLQGKDDSRQSLDQRFGNKDHQVPMTAQQDRQLPMTAVHRHEAITGSQDNGIDHLSQDYRTATTFVDHQIDEYL